MNFIKEEFCIYYDVPENAISADTFIVAAQSFKYIARDINGRIFNNAIKYEIFILPPTGGSFKQKFLICASLAVIPILGGPLGELGSGFFEGLTGHSASYYGKNAGVAIVDITKGILSKEIEELDECIPRKLNLDASLKHKSNFYSECQRNKAIRALGFTRSGEFPIKRSSFIYHISKDRERPIDSKFSLHNAIIISSVNVSKDKKDKDRPWLLRDTGDREEMKAYMEDDDFLSSFLYGHHPLKTLNIDDKIKILIEHKRREKNGKVETYRLCIRKVYALNGKNIRDHDMQAIERDIHLAKITPMEEIWKSN
jgi:hypothetical protein